MAGTIKIPTIDVSDGKLLLGEQNVIVTDEGEVLETTPLASVPESASADTVIVVKDGVPKQTPVSDLLADVESEISDIATPTYQYVSGSVSVPDSTITEVCSYTIPTSGLWLVVSKLSFSVSGTSAYNHYIFYGNNNTVVRGNMASGGGTTNAYVGILSEGTVVSARAYQTSGTTVTSNADLALVRLGNSA